MAIKVRYLSEDEIEKEAELLLAEYAETTGAPFELPVPVEEITTYHLALRLEFANLHETLRIPMLRDEPDILGAIWVDTEAVLIDRSLDPKHNPSMAGRYRFSVAHEIGHWRLHRAYIAKDANQASLFGGSPEPTVICRSSQAKEPIEWQADFYASCLLMPRHLVLNAWHERFGHKKPRTMPPKHWTTLVDSNDKFFAAARAFDQQLDDQALNEFVRPFAEKFLVSMVAMRIRLERLGLLNRERALQNSLSVET